MLHGDEDQHRAIRAVYCGVFLSLCNTGYVTWLAILVMSMVAFEIRDPHMISSGILTHTIALPKYRKVCPRYSKSVNMNAGKTLWMQQEDASRLHTYGLDTYGLVLDTYGLDT